MFVYVLKRVLQVIPTLIGITLLVFVVIRVSGDPVAAYLGGEEAEVAALPPEQIEAIREKLGLNKPVLWQYLVHVGNIVRGDFGSSFIYQGRSAGSLLLERLPSTSLLAGAALLIALLISLPGGILAALFRNRWPDTLVNVYSVVGDAMPSFWLGVMLILLFSVELRWLPVSGSGTFMHLLLPALTLGTSIAALLTRLMRSNLIEVLSLDYVRTARAKGLAPRLVLFKHALRNAMLSYVTLLGLAVPGLLGGSVIVERIFAWPGIGLLFLNALSGRDMALIQTVVIFTSALVVVTNLLVDILYSFIDPRIQYA